MQMKLFTPTQIDQILEKVAHQNPKKDFTGLISSLFCSIKTKPINLILTFYLTTKSFMLIRLERFVLITD